MVSTTEKERKINIFVKFQNNTRKTHKTLKLVGGTHMAKELQVGPNFLSSSSGKEARSEQSVRNTGGERTPVSDFYTQPKLSTGRKSRIKTPKKVE